MQEPWRVTTHVMHTEKYGYFYVNVHSDGRANATRVWGESPQLLHEWIAIDCKSTDEAKAACEARLRELIEEAATCECCGAPVGEGGVLCPECATDQRQEQAELGRAS